MVSMQPTVLTVVQVQNLCLLLVEPGIECSSRGLHTVTPSLILTAYDGNCAQSHLPRRESNIPIMWNAGRPGPISLNRKISAKLPFSYATNDPTSHFSDGCVLFGSRRIKMTLMRKQTHALKANLT